MDSLRFVIEQAQKGNVQIWTSVFTLAEVFKRKCDGQEAGLEAADDQAFEDYIAQDFIVRVQVDFDIGTAARRLLRQYPVIKKPQDAIHVATAIMYNLDELHTFDGRDLLVLNGQIPMQDGRKLTICKPPIAPDPDKGTLFEILKAPDNAEQKAASGGSE